MQLLAQESSRKTGLFKWFNRDNLIILVLAGVLLFVIALPTKDTSGADGNRATGQDAKAIMAEEEIGNSSGEKSGGEGMKDTLDAYTALQEDKLEQLLSSMKGVGNVRVMLTFVSSEELVVEKDAPTVRSNTVESDSAGGNRTVSQFETGDTTVYRNVSGDSVPYVVKVLNPRVEGVLVVAQGAADSVVSRNITEAVCALYGVEVHRVKVLDMAGAGNSPTSVSGLSGD